MAEAEAEAEGEAGVKANVGARAFADPRGDGVLVLGAASLVGAGGAGRWWPLGVERRGWRPTWVQLVNAGARCGDQICRSGFFIVLARASGIKGLRFASAAKTRRLRRP
jgi:hypothetical protein